MNQIKRQFIRCLVILACALPWAGAQAQAQEQFNEAGVIGSISYDSFTLHTKGKYTLAPGAQVWVVGNAGKRVRARIGDLDPGDFVSVAGRKLGDVNYVDLVAEHQFEAE